VQGILEGFFGRFLTFGVSYCAGQQDRSIVASAIDASLVLITIVPGWLVVTSNFWYLYLYDIW
jgi:hypothetical protein